MVEYARFDSNGFDSNEMAEIEDTIPRLVLGAAERHGARSAVEEGDVVLSYAALANAVLEAARAFHAAGVERGDRVAIWAPNGWEWIVAAVGAQAAGASLVPINTRMKGGEAGYVLRASRARILCSVGAFLDNRYLRMLADEELPDLEQRVLFRGDDPDGISWPAFLAGAGAVAPDEARERALAVPPDAISDIMFTSGTTGRPKGVMTTHGQNVRVFDLWSGAVDIREGDRYLIVNPFFHAFGYKAGWLSALIRGATVLPHAVFDVPAVLERVARERINVLPGPPALYQSILAHPERERFDLSGLRLAVTGAAAVPVELVHRMRDELGFETVLTAYGLTESTGLVSVCRPDDDPETVATTCGRAIPDTEVRCVDTEGKEVPRGEQGEVVVRGYNVMVGYFEDPEQTAAAVDRDGWLHTGDLGVMDERGYLRITDRLKDMFIMGGFNCYPAEIENLLYGCAGIAQVAVIGVPDERMGEVGMAFVVPSADEAGRALTPEAVVAWSREQMANYKVPRQVQITDELPMNASGKVLKTVLRERAAAGRAS